MVLGIGINTELRAADLPVDTATSIGIEGGTFDRHEFLASVLAGVQEGYGELVSRGTEFPASPYAERIRQGMATLGAQVAVSLPGGDVLTGRATGLDTGGDLVIDEQHHVSAGDVQHVRPAE